MEALRIINLRALGDTGTIELKPLTLLVGANSAGKSTLVRTFPLLRQSAETATSSPILWYGRYVDFGSVVEAEGRSKGEGVSFEFTLPITTRVRTAPVGPPARRAASVVVSMTIRKANDDGDAEVSACTLTCDGVVLAFTFSGGNIVGLSVDGRDETANLKHVVASPGTILPTVRHAGTPLRVALGGSDAGTYYFVGGELMTEALAEFMSDYLHGNRDRERTINTLNAVPFGSSGEMLDSLRQLPFGKRWKSECASWTTENAQFKRLRGLLYANAADHLLAASDRALATAASNVLYVGPFRATAQRYYRVQDLSVSELDYRGENLAMFLRALRGTERSAFQDFLRRHFGIDVKSRTATGHLEVVIREQSADNESYINLADSGFGYSQLLPVIAQLWSALSPKRRRNGVRAIGYHALVAIEQPELHLHPAHQSRLADAFVGAIREAQEQSTPLRLIVETHSEAIINRLGELVVEGAVSSDAMQILVFNKDPTTRVTSIQRASYGEDGSLVNWPHGFFLPD